MFKLTALGAMVAGASANRLRNVEADLDVMTIEEVQASSSYKAAIFGNGDDKMPRGYVYFTPQGKVGFYVYNLDALDEISGVEACADGGLLYHIHDAWDNIVGDSTYGGTNCGRPNTANHYDPTLACGGASNNEFCTNNAGCVPGSSAGGDQGYDCNPTTFEQNNFVCEIGDLSNKFGKPEVRHGYIYGRHYEPTTPSNYYDVLSGKSVVFHCNGGQRAFCAKIQ